MSENHKRFVQWNGQRFISLGQRKLDLAVQAILSSLKVEQQGYRSCMALLKLADKHGVNRLEATCARVLSYTPRPNFQSIKTILTTGQDRITDASTLDECAENHGIVRGEDYYGRD